MGIEDHIVLDARNRGREERGNENKLLRITRYIQAHR